MAVFTSVTLDEVNAWLQTNHQVGVASELKGISSGIENSNFFLTTQKDGVQKEFVLTLFERLSKEQLPYYLELMEHLAKKGIKVPAPIRSNTHEIVGDLNGKPATIVTKLSGKSFLNPSVRHCELVGDALAKMHLAGQDFKLSQANLRSIDWWKNTVPLVIPHLSAAQDRLIQSELAAQIDFFSSAEYKSLPSGPSHCDLFRDNVLFEDVSGKNELGGFFDFYFAGNDKWLFDLAVTINDWCIDLATGAIDQARYTAILEKYQAVRSFELAEINSWNMMLRAAALRFWVSRLWDYHLPREAKMLTPHDPTHFERILISRSKVISNIPHHSGKYAIK
jgi:homoserine kinase type II